jgi:FAD binding domain
MNTGIQDAMNLGWKLGAAMQGWAPSWLLNSYEAERHPVGRAALRITDLLQRVTLAPAPVRALRPTLARLALSLPPVRPAVRRRVSGLSIAYPPPGRRAEHPWVGMRVPDLSLGDRRLYEGLRHGRFTVLDRTSAGRFADEAADDWADRAVTIRAPHAAALGWPEVMLIRPDGYAAWASSHPDRPSDIRTALAHWLSLEMSSRSGAGSDAAM